MEAKIQKIFTLAFSLNPVVLIFLCFGCAFIAFVVGPAVGKSHVATSVRFAGLLLFLYFYFGWVLGVIAVLAQTAGEMEKKAFRVGLACFGMLVAGLTVDDIFRHQQAFVSWGGYLIAPMIMFSFFYLPWTAARLLVTAETGRPGKFHEILYLAVLFLCAFPMGYWLSGRVRDAVMKSLVPSHK